MNANSEKDLKIKVEWEEEKKFNTIDEFEKFIDKKSYDDCIIKKNKMFISYRGYEIEYDFQTGEYSCSILSLSGIYSLSEIIKEIDKKIKSKEEPIKEPGLSR